MTIHTLDNINHICDMHDLPTYLSPILLIIKLPTPEAQLNTSNNTNTTALAPYYIYLQHLNLILLTIPKLEP